MKENVSLILFELRCRTHSIGSYNVRPNLFGNKRNPLPGSGIAKLCLENALKTLRNFQKSEIQLFAQSGIKMHKNIGEIDKVLGICIATIPSNGARDINLA